MTTANGALPMCGVMGDNELFDSYVDFNLVPRRCRSADGVPFPPDSRTAVVPDVKAALGPAYPFVRNAEGNDLRRPSSRRFQGCSKPGLPTLPA